MRYWVAYWFTEVRGYQWGIFRVLFLLGAILPNRHFLNWARAWPVELSDPPFFIRLLHIPFPPTPDIFGILMSLHLFALIFSILGIKTRWSLLSLLLLELYLGSYANSFAVYFHNTSVPDLVLMVLVCAPGVGAFSLDEIFAGAFKGKRQGLIGWFRQALSHKVARWPANLILIILSLNYLCSGIAKVTDNTSWNSGRILKFYLDGPRGTYFTGKAGSEPMPSGGPALEAFTYDLRTQTQLGKNLAANEGLTRFLSVSTVLFELTFALSLLSRRLRGFYLVGGTIFHLAVFALMGLDFTALIFCYGIFVNWEAVLAGVLRRWPREHSCI